MSGLHAAVLFVGAAACVYDLRSRRIPNALTLGGAAAAVAFHTVAGGPPGLGMSLGGWAVGAALFFPVFALGGMGAGDVKLLACFGAWLGPVETFWMAIFAAISGGLMGVAVALAHGYLRTAFANVWLLLGYWRVAGVRPLPELTLEHGRGPRLAYALPITAGALVTLWLQ